METIKGCDIISLVETHSRGDDLEIKGFSRTFQLTRNAKKGRKAFGGIAVFVKDSLKNFVTEVHSNSRNVLWIKIQGSKLGLTAPLFLGTVYLSPVNKYNKIESGNFMHDLETDVFRFSKSGKVLLLGDLNARTGILSDFTDLESNNFCYDDQTICRNNESDIGLQEICCAQSFSHILERNSEDTKVCKRGKDLIGLCKNYDFAILNGRTIGDIFGKTTCFRWNGCSVVDYAICSKELFEHVQNFKVLTMIPWLSDHAAIKVEVGIKNWNDASRNTTKHLEKVPPKFYLRKESLNDFKAKLESNKITQMYNEIILDASEEKNVSVALQKLDMLVKTAAADAKIKYKKSKVIKEKVNKVWFDTECQNAKIHLRKCTKNLVKNPKDLSLRMECNTQRKPYKSLIRRKKIEFSAANIDYLSKFTKNPKIFWDKIKSLKSSEKSVISDTFSEEKVVSYFSKLLQTNRPQNIIQNNTNLKHELDGKITKSDIDQALKNSKNGKAPGIDGVNKDLVYAFHLQFPQFLPKLFSAILEQGVFPEQWSTALIVLIHKKGNKNELSNYRGISLLCILSKLFCSIINQRITKWAIKEKIFSESQLGFMKGNRTSDALSIMHNIIDKYCHANQDKFYACFVDFRKAFDKVPRDIFLQKLSSIGLHGSIFNVIKSMYTGDKGRVILGENMSREFHVNQGVRQGCVLSPTLFNIFLSDFEKTMTSNPEGNPVFLNESEKLSCLIWADDIVILSETKNGLQSQLNRLSAYSDKNILPVNTDKTKCICFNRQGKLVRSNFTFQDMLLEDVKSFLYLGFLITSNGNLFSGLRNLAERASKALFKLRNVLGTCFFRDISTAFKLFDAIVKPILLYCSDFWGFSKISTKGNSPIDASQLKFYKLVLGVSKRTSNMGVLRELERFPISIEAQTHYLNNFIRIIGKSQCNNLISKSYRFSLSSSLRLADQFEKNICKLGFSSLIKNVNRVNAKGKSIQYFKEYTQKSFLAKCQYYFNATNSKLCLFSKLKCDQREAHYLSGRNVSERSLFAKFRLSDHNLNIERGRYAKIPPEERNCPFCAHSVENEQHFLIQCNKYNDIRNEMFGKLSKVKPSFLNLNDTQKVTFLLDPCADTIGITFDFLHNANEIRTADLPNAPFLKLQ